MSDVQRNRETYLDQIKIYQNAFKSEDGKPARDYLESRGFDVNWLFPFGIGCSLEGFFKGRITFPFKFGQDYVYITSRSFTNQEPPHLHMPGTIPCFFLHNYLDLYKELVICESPIDALSLNARGILAIGMTGVCGKPKNFVGVTKDHKFTILFDNDEAGEKGSRRLAQKLLLHTGCSVKIAKLDIDKDVNNLFVSMSYKDFKEYVIEILSDSKKIVLDKKENNSKLTEGKYNKSKFSILKVIEKFVDTTPVKTGSKTYHTFCPFHNDKKTKSLAIYVDTNTFYCHGGCQQGGSPEFFVFKVLKMSSVGDALKYLQVTFS